MPWPVPPEVDPWDPCEWKPAWADHPEPNRESPDLEVEIGPGPEVVGELLITDASGAIVEEYLVLDRKSIKFGFCRPEDANVDA